MNIQRITAMGIRAVSFALVVSALGGQASGHITNDQRSRDPQLPASVQLEESPDTGDFTISYEADGQKYHFVFVPGTKIKPNVRVSVSPADTSGRHRYVYNVANGRAAKQPLFKLSLDVALPVEDVAGPPGWEPNLVTLTQRVYWYRIGYELDTGILPGANAIQFSLTSRALPGVMAARAQGRAPKAQPPTGEMPQEVANWWHRFSMSRDYVPLETIGPALTLDMNLPPDQRILKVTTSLSSNLRGPLSRAKHPDADRILKGLGRASEALSRHERAGAARTLGEVIAAVRPTSIDPWIQEINMAVRIAVDRMMAELK